jgi:hypothetical protein
MVRVHADSFDVARTQRPPAVEHASLNHRRVPDELAALPGQGVDPTERVLPVVGGHVPLEDLVEQRPRGLERFDVQARRVSGADLGHVRIFTATQR